MFILRKYSVRAQYIGITNDPVFWGVVAGRAVQRRRKRPSQIDFTVALAKYNQKLWMRS